MDSSSIFNSFHLSSSDTITINRKDFYLVQGYLRKVLELMENFDKNDENHQEMSQDLNQTTSEDISKDNDEESQSFAEDFKREVEESDCIRIIERNEVQEEDPALNIINIYNQDELLPPESIKVKSEDPSDELLNEIFSEDQSAHFTSIPSNLAKKYQLPSPSNDFKCGLCSFTHHLRGALNYHLKHVHNHQRKYKVKEKPQETSFNGSRKETKCNECGKIVAASYFSTHRENHYLANQNIHLKCNVCGFVSVSLDGIRKHFRINHRGHTVKGHFTKIKAKGRKPQNNGTNLE